MTKAILIVAALLGGLGAVMPGAAQVAVLPLTVDAAASRVLIEVGKAGVLGFAGHAHEVAAPTVRGRVMLNAVDWEQSIVSLDFDAAALRVSGANEPPADVPKVQQAMLSDRVLDVARFPSVAFRSKRIAVTGRKGTAADVRIDGDMTLHGVTRPLSVVAHASLDGADTLTTRGSFSFKQTDFKMEPVTAAGGSIRVRDALDVRFVLVAHR